MADSNEQHSIIFSPYGTSCRTLRFKSKHGLLYQRIITKLLRLCYVLFAGLHYVSLLLFVHF